MKTRRDLSYDVVCAGGGAAGVFAALAAARAGCRTLLLEREGFLGGECAVGLPLTGLPQMHTAQMEHFFNLMREFGGMAGTARRASIPVNGETVKLVFQRMCRENDVDVLLYIEAAGLCSSGGTVTGVRAVGKEAIDEIRARAAIDATAVGSLAKAAGALPRGCRQTAWAAMTLTGVDPRRLARQGGTAEPGFGEGRPGATYTAALVRGGPVCSVYVCVEPHRLLVCFPLDEPMDPDDPFSRTQAATNAHLRALELLRALTQRDGFAATRLSDVPTCFLLRETPGQKCARPAAQPGTLVLPHSPDGLLVCGALAGAASAGEAFATGEAAGVCAALAVRSGVSPAQITPAQISAATAPAQ